MLKKKKKNQVLASVCWPWHQSALVAAAYGSIARLTYQFQETTCATIVAGPNSLEVTVGVADSSPGVPGQGSQKHVLRAFTTGDALLQEGKVGGTKSAGIGLRLTDLIAHTITPLPSQV